MDQVDYTTYLVDKVDQVKHVVKVDAVDVMIPMACLCLGQLLKQKGTKTTHDS